MKFKRFFLVLLTFSIILCSCDVPAESENNPNGETGNESPSSSEEEKIQILLPEFEWEENVNWKGKLIELDPTDPLLVNDKLAVYIELTGITNQMVSDLLAAQEPSDNSVLKEYTAEKCLYEALMKKFKEQCIKDNQEFIALNEIAKNGVFIYASAEDLEYYTSCKQVRSIRPIEPGELALSTPPSLKFGKKLLPHRLDLHGDLRSTVTYYYQMLQYIPNRTDLESASDYINADRFDIQGINPIPMIKINSENELIPLKQYLSSDEWSPTDDWVDLIAGYDAEFFQTKTLFFLFIPDTSSSWSHTLGSVNVSDNSFYISVNHHVTTEARDDLVSSFMLIEVNTADIASCNVFDAWMNYQPT